MSITDIIRRLKELNDLLERAALSLEGVDEMTTLSRELYERLVVVRYKGLEIMAVNEPKPSQSEVEVIADAPTLPTDRNTADKQPKPVVEETDAAYSPTEIKNIPIGSAEVSPNQISLIDAIEEIKQIEKSLNDSMADGQPETLAQRLTMKPIADLRKAIGINQRFKYISILFDKDEKSFALAIDQLNSSNGFIEADEYIQNVLKPRYDWEIQNDVVKEFIALVQRRFL